MKIGLLCAGAALLLLAACATEKVLMPTGGSRADGTVVLTFEYGIFEKPHVDMTNAAAMAQRKCSAWGYTGAEPFEGEKQTCLAHNGYGTCMQFQINVTYQCTGTPPASR